MSAIIGSKASNARRWQRKNHANNRRRDRRNVPQSFSFGRFYRHNKNPDSQSTDLCDLDGSGDIGDRYGGYWLIVNRGVTLTKDEYVSLARRHMYQGKFDQAVLNYHKALNADPTDKMIQREHFLARSRDNMSRGSTVELFHAAAQQLLTEFPNSLIGKINVAQALELRGDVSGMHRLASEARTQALATPDTTALLAADLALATYYRTKEMQDSAYFIGNEALAAAEAIDDTFHVALVRAGLGFAAIRLDSLAFARSVFEDLLKYNGEAASSFHDVANSGLADYYHRSRMNDSARVVLERLRQVINSGAADGTTAYTLHVLGRVLRDSGQLDSAVTRLSQSLAAWQGLRGIVDVIDNLNDLAATYRLLQDYFNARKYYMAAGNMAEKFGYAAKNKYTADMNLVFLKGLKPEEYIRAGEEGKALADKYTAR